MKSIHHCSFGRLGRAGAAKKIHSSQPTLSEHISELESELGKQLFFRRGRRRVVTVTEASRVFEQFAERAVSAAEGARQALAEWMAWLMDRS